MSVSSTSTRQSTLTDMSVVHFGPRRQTMMNTYVFWFSHASKITNRVQHANGNCPFSAPSWYAEVAFEGRWAQLDHHRSRWVDSCVDFICDYSHVLHPCLCLENDHFNPLMCPNPDSMCERDVTEVELLRSLTPSSSPFAEHCICLPLSMFISADRFTMVITHSARPLLYNIYFS